MNKRGIAISFNERNSQHRSWDMVKTTCFPALLSETCWASHIFLNTDLKIVYVCLIFQVFLSPVCDHQQQGLNRKDSQNHLKLCLSHL